MLEYEPMCNETRCASRAQPISRNVTPLAGREGRLPTGDAVPVTEFGLRGRRQ